jgi:hypothetical protein
VCKRARSVPGGYREGKRARLTPSFPALRLPLSLPAVRFPVIDFTPPSLEIIEAASEYVNEVVSQGGTVYVHCKAGRGRAASVCMAYLIRSPLCMSAVVGLKGGREGGSEGLRGGRE